MFKIAISGLVVEIDNIYEITKDYCKEFISYNDKVDIRISSSLEKIEKEKDITLDSKNRHMCEITSVFREICLKALNYNVLFMHGSCISYEDQAIIFLALSGTGKSTHAKLWMKCFKDSASYVNDDKPLLRLIDDTWYACGNPWNGKHRLGENKMVPLKALCIIERANENRCVEITPKEILKKLFNQIIMPNTYETVDKTFYLLNDLLSKTDLYRIECNMDLEAAIISQKEIFKTKVTNYEN